MTNVTTNNNHQCSIALAALHDVIDPEIGLNIVDLGLIYQLDFDESSKTIFCTMTLTTQFCPMGESMTDAAKEALSNAFPLYSIQLELTFDPPWNANKISPEGQEFLNQ